MVGTMPVGAGTMGAGGREGGEQCGHEFSFSFDGLRPPGPGCPTTTSSAATSRVTTEPAPTMARRPIRTRGRTVAPAPMKAADHVHVTRKDSAGPNQAAKPMEGRGRWTATG